MKPRLQIAAAKRPDGRELTLHQHDQDFAIKINGDELMSSRRHESKLELARLGCMHLKDQTSTRILIAGLGMGYALRETLDRGGPAASAVVIESSETIIQWNQTHMAHLNRSVLSDPRVEVKADDINTFLTPLKGHFDTILLDIDGGPNMMKRATNRKLFGPPGIRACRRALRNRGCLAIWSAEPNKSFEHLVMQCGFKVLRYRVPAYKGSKKQHYFIWVASENRKNLPPGGGELRLRK